MEKIRMMQIHLTKEQIQLLNGGNRQVFHEYNEDYSLSGTREFYQFPYWFERINEDKFYLYFDTPDIILKQEDDERTRISKGEEISEVKEDQRANQ